MNFAETVLSPGALMILERHTPLSLASLLSGARSEFLNTGDYEGRLMKMMTAQFVKIAALAYDDGRFVWSDYNREVWRKFVASRASSSEGGSCVFSCEPDGDYCEAIHARFRALFIGVPTGMFPYVPSIHHGVSRITSNELRLRLAALA